jgi:hypothetical protein
LWALWCQFLLPHVPLCLEWPFSPHCRLALSYTMSCLSVTISYKHSESLYISMGLHWWSSYQLFPQYTISSRRARECFCFVTTLFTGPNSSTWWCVCVCVQALCHWATSPTQRLFWGEGQVWGLNSGLRAQGFALAKQVLYGLSYTSSPFCCGYFEDGVSWTFWLGWPWPLF